MVRIFFEEEKCKGCRLCVSVCPRKIIVMRDDVINKKGYHPAGIIEPEKCTGCSFCAIICPDCVITIGKGDDANV